MSGNKKILKSWQKQTFERISNGTCFSTLKVHMVRQLCSGSKIAVCSEPRRVHKCYHLPQCVVKEELAVKVLLHFSYQNSDCTLVPDSVAVMVMQTLFSGVRNGSCTQHTDRWTGWCGCEYWIVLEQLGKDYEIYQAMLPHYSCDEFDWPKSIRTCPGYSNLTLLHVTFSGSARQNKILIRTKLQMFFYCVFLYSAFLKTFLFTWNFKKNSR